MSGETVLKIKDPPLNKRDRALLKMVEKQLLVGDASLYNEIFYPEFWEVPVDYYTFLTDRRYLGNTFRDENDELTLWPKYVERAKNYQHKELVIARGATGIGKTSAVQAPDLLYDAYKVMCLKNPKQYFGRTGSKKIFFLSINPINRDMAEKNGWGTVMTMIETSPWFLEQGTIRGNIHKRYYPNNQQISFNWGSTASYITGLDPFSIMYDEISEQSGNSKTQNEKGIKLVNAGSERIASRFPVKDGVKLRPRLSVASSEKTEQAFIHEYEKKQREMGNTDIEVIRGPRWDFDPTLGNLIREGKVFYIALGDMRMPNEVIGRDKRACQKYIDCGYTIMEIPDDKGIWKAFNENIDLAFTNVAGITVSNSMRYLSSQLWYKCIDENAPRLFARETYKVGVKDSIQYVDLIDYDAFNKIPKELFRKKWFLRFDIAFANSGGNNRCGIGMDTIESVINSENGDMLVNYLGLFHIGIEAPDGDKMSFQKHRQFIRDLKKLGFKLKVISSDLRLMSADMAEQMIAEGYNFLYRSVDIVKRIGNDKLQPEYAIAKTIIHEGRYRHAPNKLLSDEVSSVVREANTGRIDHTADGGINSKDLLDSMVGNLAIASEHVSEFVNEFGVSDVKRIVKANAKPRPPNDRELVNDTERAKMIENLTQDIINDSLDKALKQQGRSLNKPTTKSNTACLSRRFIH